MSRTWRTLGKMSGAGCTALAAGIVLASIGLSAAQGEDFPLKVRQLSEEEMVFVPGVSAPLSPMKPKGVTAEPNYKHILPPRYFQARLGSSSLTMVFDCSNPKARTYDVVYVDRDGDGNLAEETPVQAVGKRGGVLASFQPVTVDLPFAGAKRQGLVQVRAHISGEQLFQAVVAPATCLEGTVRLGAQECRVALVDGDLSGVLGDGEGASCADTLLIDLNGDHAYDRRGGFPIPAAQEVRPLSECWQVGNTWWSATVAGDWGALTVKPADVEYGELHARGPTVQALVLTSRRHGRLVVTFKDGVAKLPVGEYAVEQIQLTAKDAQGRPWQLAARGGGGRGLLKVAADAAGELDLSKPIVGTVEAYTGAAGQVQFSLLLAVAGQQVASLTVGGRTPAEPAFAIRDEKGAAVAIGKFAYG